MFCIFCGILLRVYECKAWFALSGYEISAQSKALEQRLWEVFPQRDLKFWPYLLEDSKNLREFLERDMPVTVETKMLKFGKFKTEIKWIEPWLKVYWRERVWYISKEKKMWALDDEINRNFKGTDPPIVWKIPKDLPGVGENMPLFGVFDSPLPTETIENFLNKFSECNWFQFVSEISWQRRAGSDLFVLDISKNNQRFELLIQNDKYAQQDLGLLIEDVFEELAKEGGNHIIDATYQGKIVLRHL